MLVQLIAFLVKKINFKNPFYDFKNFRKDLPATIGTLLHVKAKLDSSIWIVSNDFGVVVFEPDFLVSSTSVVGKKLFLLKTLSA